MIPISASVTRRETFNAGHRLFRADLSDEQNLAIFGKCARPSGHGHNYVLEVTISGEIEPATGFVFDLKHLSSIIRKLVIDDLDHSNLNTDVDWLRCRNPTTEVLAATIWERLEPHLPPDRLHSVRVLETESNWAEVMRPTAT